MSKMRVLLVVLALCAVLLVGDVSCVRAPPSPSRASRLALLQSRIRSKVNPFKPIWEGKENLMNAVEQTLKTDAMEADPASLAPFDKAAATARAIAAGKQDKVVHVNVQSKDGSGKDAHVVIKLKPSPEDPELEKTISTLRSAVATMAGKANKAPAPVAPAAPAPVVVTNTVVAPPPCMAGKDTVEVNTPHSDTHMRSQVFTADKPVKPGAAVAVRVDPQLLWPTNCNQPYSGCAAHHVTPEIVDSLSSYGNGKAPAQDEVFPEDLWAESVGSANVVLRVVEKQK